MSATATRRPFTITQLRRDERGHWTARLTLDGRTFAVSRSSGSWTVRDGERERILLPYFAAALQERVRPIERAERRAKEAAQKAQGVAA